MTGGAQVTVETPMVQRNSYIYRSEEAVMEVSFTQSADNLFIALGNQSTQ